MTKDPAADHVSPASIISYVVLAIFALTVAGVFALVGLKVDVDPVMLTVLGAVVTAVTGSVTGVLGFWMGSSSGAKTSNAALAQLAGAGPAPPATPLAPSPAPEPAVEILDRIS